jgi:phage shock protein A
MAVVRARSSPPYGLFMAVAFAVLATGAAVFFYLMWNKSMVEHDAAVANLAAVGGADYPNALRQAGIAQYSDKSSAVSQLIASINELNKELASARSDLDASTRNIRGNQERLDQLARQVKQFSDSATALEKAKGEIQDTFNKKAASDLETIKKLNEAIASTGAERDAKLKEAQDEMEKRIGIDEDDRRKLVLQLDDANSQIARLTAEIRDLRQRIINQGSKTDVSIGEPDGRVVRVNGATGEVYINLGKKDRMAPGLPFTAYDPRTGVRFGTDEAAQGNGSLEVIEVGEETSLCRVTRTTKDRAIQANDLIANIVYHNDRSRKFRFTVFGDFDLDGDGVATAAERDRLIVLIRSWGGQVDDDVTSQTDYLVLGEKPKSPILQETSEAASAPADAAASAPSSGIIGGVGEVRTKDQARYDELEIAAKRLAIPVLNANRFLNMVGYYNTTVVRY